MAKAKQQATTKSAKPSDEALIRECVVYAQSVAAHHAGFKADPDGDNRHAATLGNHSATAGRALQKIARIRAKTPEGLYAKARILPMVIDDSYGGMEEDDEAFYRSFAEDVRAFLKPIVEENWRADRRAAA